MIAEIGGFNTTNGTSLTTQFTNVFSEIAKGNLKVQGRASDIANAMDVLPSPPDVTNITTLSTDGSVYTGSWATFTGRRLRTSSVKSNFGPNDVEWHSDGHVGAGAAGVSGSGSTSLPRHRRRLFQSATDTATVVAAITAVTTTLNTLLATLQAAATVSLSTNAYLDWRSYTTQIAQVNVFRLA